MFFDREFGRKVTGDQLKQCRTLGEILDHGISTIPPIDRCHEGFLEENRTQGRMMATLVNPVRLPEWKSWITSCWRSVTDLVR